MDNKQFALNLTDNAKNNAEWLNIVEFGLGTLLDNQDLLVKILVEEAIREQGRASKKEPLSFYLAELMQLLQIKISVV